MDQVVSANCGQITITAEDHYLQLRIGQLQACGEGNGPPVGGMKGIQLDVTSSSAGAPDPGND